MIAERLASWLTIRTLDPLNPRDPAIVRMLGMGNVSTSGVQVDSKTVLGYPAVYRGLNIIGNGLMKVRPIIYRRTLDGKERDHNHPSWRCVTRRASANISAGLFRKSLTIVAVMRGNGLGYIERDAHGRVTDMFPLIPDSSGMAVMRNGQPIEAGDDVRFDDRIVYWTRVGGQMRTLDPSNVIHIKGFCTNGLWSPDVVDILQESLGIGLAAQSMASRFYGQGATSSGLLTMPPGLKGPQQDEFRTAITKGYSGLTKAHKFMILEDGAKFTPFTIEPDKAQFLQTREFETRQIANIIGVQAHKIGDVNRLSYNSLEQSNQEHLDDDLDPWLQVWEDELEAKCLTEDEQISDSHFIEFNRKALVRTNLTARTERHRFEREHGISSANDILKQENMDPIGPVGDTYMVPANMTVLDKSGMPIIQGTPEPRGESREEFNALAMHEVERAVRRTCNEAREASGDARKFLDFLAEIAGEPDWAMRPACVAPMILRAIHTVHARLDELTRPPYTANDLRANVAARLDSIHADALFEARNELGI